MTKLSRSLLVWKIFLLIGTFPLLFSCKKEEKKPDTPVVVEARKVKYSIEGNYSGKVSIVYYDKSETALTETNITLPWSKEFEADKTSKFIGLNANTTSTSTLGVSGQTLTAKIFLNGTEKKSVGATADKDGHITFSSLMHYF